VNPTAFYQPGVPTEIDPPTDSLVQIIEQAAARGGKLVATDFFGRTTTFAELRDQILRVAEGLRRLGVRRGDRVAIILPNCPQHIVAFFAILRLGAYVVEHNPLYTPRELRHMFEDHSARVVIAWDAAVKNLRALPADIEFDHVISVNLLKEFPLVKRLALKLPVPSLRAMRKKLTEKVKNTITWETLLTSRPLKRSYPRPGVTDIAAIQYTSGTTGLPKGAILTHSNLYTNARQAEAWMPDIRDDEEVFYAVLPFFHGYGLTYMLYSLVKRARLHLFPTFDVNMVLDVAKKNPPTVLCAVPPIFEALTLGAKRRRISLKTARWSMSGAMSLSLDVTQAWENLTGGKLIEGYGMTEASPVALGNPFHEARRIGTIGLPFPSTQVKVVDADDWTKEVPTGERGELLIRGPQVFQGYWNNPTETERTLLPGGWLASGDIVTQDAEGFVTVVDRKKELIITSGFNISPTEVELVLKSHPAIQDAAVVGLPHPHSGEMVAAGVVAAEGHTIDQDEIRAFCKTRLAGYKVPRRIIALDSFPKSLLGKVLRAEVKAILVHSVGTKPLGTKP
jgi:long-chain acyl-CoA synthetase